MLSSNYTWIKFTYTRNPPATWCHPLWSYRNSILSHNFLILFSFNSNVNPTKGNNPNNMAKVIHSQKNNNLNVNHRMMALEGCTKWKLKKGSESWQSNFVSISHFLRWEWESKILYVKMYLLVYVWGVNKGRASIQISSSLHLYWVIWKFLCESNCDFFELNFGWFRGVKYLNNFFERF